MKDYRLSQFMWNYKTLHRFNKAYYEGLITEAMACGDEMFITVIKDDEGQEKPMDMFVYPYRKGKDIYLIPSLYVNKLPVQITKENKVSYAKKGYVMPNIDEEGNVSLTPMRIIPEKAIDPRRLLETFAPFDVTNPIQDKLMKAVALVAYIDRINVAICGTQSSGKTSKFESLKPLMGNIASVGKPTMAKLKYLLGNQTLVINEINGLDKASREDVEMFFLDAGDGKETFENNSRSVNGTKEVFDISKLSLVLVFNTFAEMKYKKEKFFSTMWDNDAVVRRFFPVLFDNAILTDFHEVFDVDAAVKHNFEEYVKFIKTIRWLRKNYIEMDYKTYGEQNYKFDKKHNLWKNTFYKMKHWLAVFATDEQEYNLLLQHLYRCHTNYLAQLDSKPALKIKHDITGKKINPKLDDFSSGFEEEIVGE